MVSKAQRRDSDERISLRLSSIMRGYVTLSPTISISAIVRMIVLCALCFVLYDPKLLKETKFAKSS